MCILFFWKLTEFWDRLVLSICAKTRHDLCSSDQRTFQKNNYSFYDTLTSCSEVISVTSSPSYLEFILFTSFLNNTCVDRWADKLLMSGWKRSVRSAAHITEQQMEATPEEKTRWELRVNSKAETLASPAKWTVTQYLNCSKSSDSNPFHPTEQWSSDNLMGKQLKPRSRWVMVWFRSAKYLAKHRSGQD